MITSIYIAGPMTEGYLPDHLREVVRTADVLMLAGYVPFVPHLTAFWSMMLPHDYGYDAWMDYDYYWLAKCDAILRLDGYSPGADLEIQFAQKNNIPIFLGKKGLRELLDLKEG